MRVRNLITGVVHEVPAGHPALDDPSHEVIVEASVAAPEVEPEPEAEPEPEPKRRGRRPKGG